MPRRSKKPTTHKDQRPPGPTWPGKNSAWEFLKDAPEGQATITPFSLPNNYTVQGMISTPLPWGPPALLGCTGVNFPNGEYEVHIAHEWPIPHDPTLKASKDDVELIHLEKYCTDFLLSCGHLPYTDIVRGSDPPDFIATTKTGTSVTVDCTQLGLRERRMATALFKRLRQRLSDESRKDLAHLNGLMIYASFFKDHGQALPSRTSSLSEVEQIVRALLDADRETLLGRRDEPTHTTSSLFHAVRMTSGVPATSFFINFGFEIGFNYCTAHKPQDFWREIDRLVASHDKGTADELLITASAPARDGYIYPSEEIFSEFVFFPERPQLQTKNLKKVVIHSWFNGAITQILPRYKQIALPLYGGHVIPHHPLGRGGPGRRFP